ncbi:MAG: hypothetical protein JNG88_15335 [Phycisphaerales bacterium]|nr:hypothetical protein [Phycisphaerales bacterium]
MRTVYATQFEIEAPENSAGDYWDRVCGSTSGWVELYYGRKQIAFDYPTLGGVARPADDHVVEVDLQQPDESTRLCTVDWSHPDDGDSTLRWQVQVTIAQASGRVECAIVIRVSSSSFSIIPARFTLRRPGLVRTLIESLPCKNASVRLQRTARELSVGDLREFVSLSLANPQRALPVVVVSKDVFSEKPAVDPDDLADRLVGLAEVAVTADKWAGFQLTDELGTKSLSCYDGAVRLYWPGFSVYAQPANHPLWLKGQIEWHESNGRPLSDFLMKMLAGIASFRHTDGKTIRAAREAVRRERAKHLEDLRAKVAKGGEGQAELESLINDLWTENDKLKKERDEAFARRDEVERDLQAAKANLETMYQYQSEAEPTKATPQAAPAEAVFSNVLEATRAAADEFCENLLFLDSAFDAAKDSPFQRPERVKEALQAIDEVCREWRTSLESGVSMGTWESAFERRGFDYKNEISQTTRTKFGHEYMFMYKGKKRLFEKHITDGAKQAQKCFSIHMYRDEDERRVVIGHVGRHLTNTKT